MGTTERAGIELVLHNLKEFGLLLESDAKLPSVSGLVAGDPIKGSWWAHPKARQIFAVLQPMVDHQDVLIVKLISGKVTFVHRKLWPDILSVGSARDEWQMNRLTPAARLLLQIIDADSESRSDHLDWPPKFKSVKPGEAVRELEKRLLIHTEELHTESGAHAKKLETWEHWANRTLFKRQSLAAADAKRQLEQRLAILNKRFGAAAEMPWAKIK